MFAYRAFLVTLLVALVSLRAHALRIEGTNLARSPADNAPREGPDYSVGKPPGHGWYVLRMLSKIRR